MFDSGKGASSGRWAVFALCALLFISSQFYRASNAIIAPDLRHDLGLSAEALGLLTALFFYTFALVQLPLGPCLDRVGARRTMAFLTLIGSVGAWIFASAKTFQEAAFGRILLGLGMSANLMGSMKLFTTWFPPQEFATLSGLILALGTVGNMAAATPLALLVEAVGWRWSFALIGGLTACLAFAFLGVVREGPKPVMSKGEGFPLREMVRMLVGRRDYWLISFSTFLRYGIFVAIQGLWAGPYLMEVMGLSPVEAGNVLLLLNVGLVAGSPLGGWLSDRLLRSRKKVVIMGLGGMASSLFLISTGLALGSPVVTAGLFCFFGIFSGFGIVMYAHIKELMPEGMTGMALTWVNLFTMFGGGVFLHLLGWVLDRLSGGGPAGPREYAMTFLLGALGLTSAFLLYFLTRERKS